MVLQSDWLAVHYGLRIQLSVGSACHRDGAQMLAGGPIESHMALGGKGAVRVRSKHPPYSPTKGGIATSGVELCASGSCGIAEDAHDHRRKASINCHDCLLD